MDLTALLRDRDWLRRVAAALTRDPALAEDLVQETYLAAVRQPPLVANNDGRGWLATVLRHRFASYHRRWRRRDRIAPGALAGTDTLPELPDAAPDPEAVALRLELGRQVAGLVLALPLPQREALLLCTVEGLSSAEAAARLGVPAGTVRWRVKEALDHLRAELDRGHGDRKIWRALLLPLALPLARDAAPIAGRVPPAIRTARLGVGIGAAAIGLVAIVALFVTTSTSGDRVFPKVASRASGIVAAIATERPVRRAEALATIHGRVLDAEGRPVPKGIVSYLRTPRPHEQSWLFSTRTPYTVADLQGRYRLIDVPPGVYTLAATSERGTPISAKREIAAGQDVLLDLHQGKGGVRLAGRIVDHAAGAIAGGEITFVARGLVPGEPFVRLLTLGDEKGNFAVQVTADTYMFITRAPGYALGHASHDVVGAMEIALPLTPEALISGRIQVDGAPAAGAEVMLLASRGRFQSPRAATVADDKGQFTFDGLEAGTYQVTARAGRYSGRAPEIALALAERSEIALSLTPGIVVHGRVRGTDGKPVKDVAIVATPIPGPGQPSNTFHVSGDSDEQGRFTVEGLAPVPTTFRAHHPGHAPFMLDLTPAADARLDVTLTPAAILTGIVFGSDGRPVADARVQARVRTAPQRGDANWLITDAEGRFRSDNLPAGPLQVVAWSPTEVAFRDGLELAGGRETEVALRLAPGARVAGQVVDDAGKAVPHIQVRSQSRAHPFYYDFNGRADEQGRFDVGPFLPGTASVVALAPDNTTLWSSLKRPEQQDVAVVAGQRFTGARLVVAARTGEIAGFVSAPDGSPLADAEVFTIPFNPAHPPRRGQSASEPATITDEAGRFQVKGLRGPRHVLWAVHPAYPDARLDQVAVGTRDVRVTMPRGGRLSGVVVDSRGVPVTAYDLLIVAAAKGPEDAHQAANRRMNRERPIIKVNDPTGRFGVDRVAEGPHEIVVLVPSSGLMAALPSIDVASRPRELRLVAAPALVARGQIVGEDGQPLAGEVGVLGLEGFRRERTSPDGRFELAGLLPAPRVRLYFNAIDERQGRRLAERSSQGQIADFGVVRLSRSKAPCDCRP